jgi:hypothetical protein
VFGSARPGSSAGTVPSTGVWGRAQPAPQPQYAQSPQPAPQPWGQPAYGAQPMMGGGYGGYGGGGFLRSAAATAAGIAGGALLFQGIQSMFGHSALSGIPQQAGLTENITNNYYGSDSAPTATDAGPWDASGAPAPGGGADLQYAADQDPGAPAQDYAADQGYALDSGADYAADTGGFGGDDSDVV